MKIAPEHLARIRGYGYSPTEAQFLYLVATHSGYFTQRQFLRFADVKSGGSAIRFTQKILRLGHGRANRYGHHTFIYNVHSRLIYEPIEKDNLRNCRRLSNDWIRTRLMILDFVLDHLQHQYLETEADKVGFSTANSVCRSQFFPDGSIREKIPMSLPNAILSIVFLSSCLVMPPPCFLLPPRLFTVTTVVPGCCDMPTTSASTKTFSIACLPSTSFMQLPSTPNSDGQKGCLLPGLAIKPRQTQNA